MSIFITGGSEGLGLELAKVYLRQGFVVGVCSRKSLTNEFIEKEIGEGKGRFFQYRCDVRNRSDLESALRQLNEIDPVMMVVANAGIDKRKPLQSGFSHYEDVISTNLMGVINTIDVAVNLLCPRRTGRIAVISSIASLYGLPRAAPYCASKAAVNVLCESLRHELKVSGIDLTVIMPGGILTKMTQPKKLSPFGALTAARAAEKCARAIEQGRRRYAFPKPQYFLFQCMKLMPEWVLSRLFKKVYE
ncbi:MAG: SDR family NAD(P)-dependent oxidoreductase [Proteobacteria bacterium]|nr:SDR family NAD(P)-dependent oxidoreductase [Pseudomonadota bacterium]